MSVYTDLAKEIKEAIPGDIDGVVCFEEENNGVMLTRIEVINKNGEEVTGKPCGRYTTVEIPHSHSYTADTVKVAEDILTKEIKDAAGNFSIALVLGLGNRRITPDSLGSRVIDKLLVTRHIFKEAPQAMVEGMANVSAIAPGVLGVTGVETLEILSGVCDSVNPDVIIVIDALASSRAHRIGYTFQISDTGIQPGGGVGNRRKEISEKTVGRRVVSVGVPTVVYARTIARDCFMELASKNGEPLSADGAEGVLNDTLADELKNLIVAPSDIDSIIDKSSSIIASAINRALHYGLSKEEILDLV